jgi:hypothetical protein
VKSKLSTIAFTNFLSTKAFSQNNAKNLYGISKLRKLKQETNELCQELIKSYKKYVESFDKLHNILYIP